jgi:alpha-glucosidase
MTGSSFRFAGDVVNVLPHLHSGVELETPEARIRVEGVTDGIFRVRALPDTSRSFEDPPFSAAVCSDSLEMPSARIDAGPETIRISIGTFRAVLTLSPCRIAFQRESGNLFAEDSFGAAWAGDRFVVHKRKAPGERFFGLGEKAFPLDRTGKAFSNWNTDFYGYTDRVDPLYKTFPVYLALSGEGERRIAYGVFLDNSFRSTFDFGAAARNQMAFGADGGELRYYVICGPAPEDVLERYTRLTGRMALPALWTLGYHQSRWSYYPESTIQTLARQFRDRGIPLDAFHLDIHYMDEYRIFTWDREHFPDPPAMISNLREQGVRTVLIVDPGVKVDPDYNVYREGLQRDAFVRYPDQSVYTGSVWPGECAFPDYTKPDARDWFADYMAGLKEDGVAGVWTDMNEPSVSGGPTMPDIVHHDLEGRGGSHLEAHNLYGMQMARSVRDGLLRHAPDERPFVITRAAFAGTQRYAIVWTGDSVADWADLRMVPSMLLSLGLSGMPCSGSDVGGFLGSASPELFVRWLQMGTLSPFFRTHVEKTASQKEPWSYGPDIEEIARGTIEFRYRLLPYLYTLFDEHTRTGLPLLRPLWFHHVNDEEAVAAEHDFLVGTSLLAAPVLEPNHRTRRVYLPEGAWYDFNSGERMEGGRYHLVEAPLERLPLFVRAGSVLPIGPVLQHTGDAPGEPLDIRLYAGTGTGALYEDEGNGFRYRDGDFRRSHFSLSSLEDGSWALDQVIEGSRPHSHTAYRLRLIGFPESMRIMDGDHEMLPGQDSGGESIEVPADFMQLLLVPVR